MRIETWKSDKGGHEVHHFVEGDDGTYLFGLNVEFFGEEFYKELTELIQKKTGAIQDAEAIRFAALLREAKVTEPFIKARAQRKDEPFND